MSQYVIQKLNAATKEWNDIYDSTVGLTVCDEFIRLNILFPDWQIRLIEVMDVRPTKTGES